ncbi:hypothetical protein [Sphingomonas sp.]|uniref:hypothetical protein n=1 Tax=Sphingomonas sp. TaxID=28214 RepID=UPI003B3AC1AE
MIILRSLAWLANTAFTIILVIRTHRSSISSRLKWSGLALAAAPAIVVIVTLLLAALHVQPPPGFGTIMFQLLFTVTVMAMVNLVTAIFAAMVEAQIAFHEKYNAANLYRFPVSFLIARPEQLKWFVTLVFCGGSGLMLYGIWFDTHI